MRQQALDFGDAWPLAGVDEAGRGPLAGPVVAAAVILDTERPVDGLRDSKRLSAGRRTALAREIVDRSLAWSVGWADAAEIDGINILQATLLAMRRAILGLRIQPAFIAVDGNRLPSLRFHGWQPHGSAVVGGDGFVPEISAASIIAKVRRDQIMRDMDLHYPQYGFRRHMGYATADHRARIGRYGPCRQHRRSFAPIRTMK